MSAQEASIIMRADISSVTSVFDINHNGIINKFPEAKDEKNWRFKLRSWFLVPHFVLCSSCWCSWFSVPILSHFFHVLLLPLLIISPLLVVLSKLSALFCYRCICHNLPIKIHDRSPKSLICSSLFSRNDGQANCLLLAWSKGPKGPNLYTAVDFQCLY